jgi:hypothetical protein
MSFTISSSVKSAISGNKTLANKQCKSAPSNTDLVIAASPDKSAATGFLT